MQIERQSKMHRKNLENKGSECGKKANRVKMVIIKNTE